MSKRGGRVRKDSYQGFDARDFVSIKKYDTNNLMYLDVPKYVKETFKSKFNKYKTENFDTYNSAIVIKRQIEKQFIILERKRIDEFFRKHERRYK
tara:strand:- start:1457 stop:1741 length:285 start_codon:yes stop_codon:yes gene_type:complete